MASGISGAKESSKNKWGENIKVYARKIHVRPEKNFINNTLVSKNRLNDKNDEKTSDKTAVKSNGVDKNNVDNGTLTGKNVEKNCENGVGEVTHNKNSVKEVSDITRNNLERNGENVVEEALCNENIIVETNGGDKNQVTHNKNSVKEVSDITGNNLERNGENVVEEALCNENIVVETNGGDKNHVINDTLIESDVEMNREKVIKEVLDNEICVKEVPTVTGNDLEKTCENVLEEVPSNENIIEEMVETTNNEYIVKEVSTMTNDVEKSSEKIIEEVPSNGNIAMEVLDAVDSDKKTLCNGNDLKDVTNTQQVSKIENNIEAPKGMTNVNGTLHNEYNVIESPHIEKNVVDAPNDHIEMSEEVLRKSSSPKFVEEANLLQLHHNPSNVETSLPNGHDHNGVLVNGAIREERPAAKSKEEVRYLKRKLEDELNQIRKMARKLQVKETQLSSVGFDRGMSREKAPVNGGLENDVNSMTGIEKSSYVGYDAPRSFIQLSSSVTNDGYHGLGENVHEKEKRTPKANQFYQNSEFLLGKEKIPSAESNKKAKSSGRGRKHGNRDIDSRSGFDKKFRKKCNDLLQRLRNHKHGWVFNVPVDVNKFGIHDYFDIIKNPMDLGTVKTRLTTNWYKTPRAFAEDVRLTFHNAMTYNPAGQDVHIMAKELLRILEEKWSSIEADYDRKSRYETFRDAGPIHMPLPPPPLLHLPPSFQELKNSEMSQSMPVQPEAIPKFTPSVGRTPAPKKPKARDPDKRDMTFDEKQKLSTNLQCLPSEKLDDIVQIIKRRDSAFSQHDDEIEVDIDKVDAETLWELDRFVVNYKKRLSKHKRKAEIAMQARAAAAEAARETVPPAPANVEAPKEDRTGIVPDEGNVGASRHVQQERHGENAGDSSNTSSSSDSGSSSSDSDSDSSSDSEQLEAKQLIDSASLTDQSYDLAIPAQRDDIQFDGVSYSLSFELFL
ncbi:hypothetical protein RND81_12G235600 [Saponaria officinalis]|uniref:Transcription factor GTE4 n=1 Tax=Saponaria officinalis TaxID=3572 RepID=A0AAW1HEP7_SAPOF